MTSRRLPSLDRRPSVPGFSDHFSSTYDPEGSELSSGASNEPLSEEQLQSTQYRMPVTNHLSLSLNEETVEALDNEEGFMSPRQKSETKEEFVSNFVARGGTFERDIASYRSSSPCPATSLNASQVSVLSPNELVPQVLSAQQEIAHLQRQLDDHTASFQLERDLLAQDLTKAREMNIKLQQKIVFLEEKNRKLDKEVQRNQQLLESNDAEARTLQAHITKLEREKAALTSEMHEHQQKANDCHMLRSKLERMAAQWKNEKAKLLHDLDEAKAVSEQKCSKEWAQHKKRITEIEDEVRELKLRLGNRRDTSPAEYSPRPTPPRSRSQVKIKRLQSPTKPIPDSSLYIPKEPTLATQKKLLRDIGDFLGVSQFSDLLQTIKRLSSQSRSQQLSEAFTKQLSQLVIDISPPQTFDSYPTLHQIWKWIKRLIDEYMALRRNRDEFFRSQEALKEIADMLRTEFGTEKLMLKAVINELSDLRDVERELRAHLNLGDNQPTKALLTALKELRASP